MSNQQVERLITALEKRKIDDSAVKERLTTFPGGGLGIFTDRDQRSIFWGYEFRKSVFWGDTGHSCCTFLGC